MKRYEIEPKTVQVRIYDLHPDHYDAQFTGYVVGNRLHISGLVSRVDGFYFQFGELLPALLADLGCVRADLVCTPTHARLLQSALSRWVDVIVQEHFHRLGREFVEVILMPKDRPATPYRRPAGAPEPLENHHDDHFS